MIAVGGVGANRSANRSGLQDAVASRSLMVAMTEPQVSMFRAIRKVARPDRTVEKATAHALGSAGRTRDRRICAFSVCFPSYGDRTTRSRQLEPDGPGSLSRALSTRLAVADVLATAG